MISTQQTKRQSYNQNICRMILYHSRNILHLKIMRQFFINSEITYRQFPNLFLSFEVNALMFCFKFDFLKQDFLYFHPLILKIFFSFLILNPNNTPYKNLFFYAL